MPATTPKQRMLMGLAEHHPEQVSRKNRGVLKMSQGQLHDFASTKGLGSPVHHDTAPAGGFAHMGTTVEGPDHRGAEREGATFTTGNREGAKAFAHAGTTREGPRHAGAAKAGPTVSSMGSYDHAHGFANAGSTREGPTYHDCLASKSEGWGSDGVSRMRLHRGPHEVVGSERKSGDHGDGFHTHLAHSESGTDGRHDAGDHAYAGPQLGHPRAHSTPVHSGAHTREPDVVHNSPPKYASRAERARDTAPLEHRPGLGKPVSEGEGRRGFHTQEHTAPRERANAETHYGLNLSTRQPHTRHTGGYEGAREANWTPSGKIGGQKHQAGPRHGVARGDRHAFKMATPQHHVQAERARRTA
jgi:hypothetical protein